MAADSGAAPPTKNEHSDPNAGRAIVNPRTGQTMIFRQTAADTNGRLLQIECFNEPQEPIEPEHIHPNQDSRCQVLTGALTFRIDGVERVVRAGETVTIPAGERHCFWNDGSEVAHHLQEFRPALRTQLFFDTLFALARDGQIDDKGMPKLLPLALLVPAFGDEIRPVRPPWPLLRVLAWLLGPIARLRGYRIA
jgi:quercetin dioxygenase-like cupin family protein